MNVLIQFIFLFPSFRLRFVSIKEPTEDTNGTLHVTNTTVPAGIRSCNTLSTGAILLADILPSLAVKMITPFLPFYVQWVSVCVPTLLSNYIPLIAFHSSRLLRKSRHRAWMASKRALRKRGNNSDDTSMKQIAREQAFDDNSLDNTEAKSRHCYLVFTRSVGRSSMISRAPQLSYRRLASYRFGDIAVLLIFA